MLYPCSNFLPLSRCSFTAALSTSISHVLTLSKGSNSIHMPHPCWHNLLLSTGYTPLLLFYLFSHGLLLSTCFTSFYLCLELLYPASHLQVGPPIWALSCWGFLPVKGFFSLATGSQALGFCKAPWDNFDCVRCYMNTDELIFFFQRFHLCPQVAPLSTVSACFHAL